MWWLLACQTPSIDWEESYRQSPEQVVLNLEAMKNPTERLAVVESLQQAFPGQTEDLCQTLPSVTQEYCVKRKAAGSAHLWMPVKRMLLKMLKSRR